MHAMEFQDAGFPAFLSSVAAIAEAEVPTLRCGANPKLRRGVVSRRAHQGHFLCGDLRQRVTHASLHEFLPKVTRDVLPRDARRHRIQKKCNETKVGSRVSTGWPRCHTTSSMQFSRRHAHVEGDETSESDYDHYLARYGGRLLGGTGETTTSIPPSIAPTFTPTLMFHCVMAALTSSAFGFDTGASSAALYNFVHVGGLPIDQHLGPLLQGWILSSAWVGNFIGTFGSFFVTNSRVLLIASGVLNGIGGLSAGLAPNLPMLIAGRVLCGVGNGFVCVGLSMYLGEIAPAESRGGSISCLESAFITGAFAGAVVGRMWLNADGGWRWIWGTCCPIGLLATLAMLQLPDTPRAIYLRAMAAARRGHVVIEGESGGTGSGQLVEGDFERHRAAALEVARRDAERVMCRLRGLDAPDEKLLAELDDMDEFYASASPGSGAAASSRVTPQLVGELSLREALSSSVERKNLFKGALAMLTPALTGHAGIMSYGTQMFASVGYEVSRGADLNVLLQAVKLAVTLPDFLWLDNVPRRSLMIVGLVGVAASYALAMLALPLHQPGLAALSLLASAAAYQASVGPLSWIMPPEVLSAEFRSRGSAVLSASYAASGVMLVQLHPLLAQQGRSVVLSVYTLSTIGALALNRLYLPETRGLSLEAIERQAIREDMEDEAREHERAH